MTQCVEVSAPALPAPKELIVKGGSGAVVAYACPKCGLLVFPAKDGDAAHRAEKYQEAAAHCVKSCACGKPVESHYQLRCHTCLAELADARERQRFEAAKRLTIEEYPDHPVFWSGHSGDMSGDGYFSSVDMLLDYCEDRGVDLPEYVWACTRRDLKLNAERILQDVLEQQDMDPDTANIPTAAGLQLQAFLDAWSKELGIHSWFEDQSRAVVLREEAPSRPPPTA